ncbi:hypothetical protein HT102_05815 [Hoyosella sp. G463]|uniref:Uncharacterized protein n=1 Tax=Lolliginicoccus lacisalsi TaxID=2742202 RepID=A0A927PKQ9_9ACTN|nr:hypothetical protein [Lolliginicoccus lacisalsi]MBD8505998.1 hypothetical protein [Lolliginicoccus lacisalsi]
MTTAITRPAAAHCPGSQHPSSPYRSPVTGRTDRGPGFQRHITIAGTTEFKERMQPVLDRLRPYCSGQSTDDAARRLEQAWASATGETLPRDLRASMATILAWGERVVLV